MGKLNCLCQQTCLAYLGGSWAGYVRPSLSSYLHLVTIYVFFFFFYSL